MNSFQNIYKKTLVFLEMIKFEHSIFALPFAYLGLILAEDGWPRLFIFCWVTLAMVSFRTMAMAANRLIDCSIDAANPRTQGRALPAKKLKTSFVWIATLISFLLFELACIKLGALCFRLSPIPVALAWLYPLMKRFTWFSHFVLGIILGIAPYGAWLASRGSFSWIPGLLTLGITTWVAGFDIIYALQDLEFDQQSGLHSFPSRFGFKASLRCARLLHLFTVVAWILAGELAGLGNIFRIGMVVIVFFLAWEHWLIRSAGLKKIEEAFFTMNAIVSVSFFVIVLIDLSFGGVHS